MTDTVVLRFKVPSWHGRETWRSELVSGDMCLSYAREEWCRDASAVALIVGDIEWHS